MRWPELLMIIEMQWFIYRFIPFANCDCLLKRSHLKSNRNFFRGLKDLASLWGAVDRFKARRLCWRSHGWHRWGGPHLLCLGLCGICWDHPGCGRDRPLPGNPDPQGDQQRRVPAGRTANDGGARRHVAHGQLHVRHHRHRHAGRGLPLRRRLLALRLLLRYHVSRHGWDLCSTVLQTGHHQRLRGELTARDMRRVQSPTVVVFWLRINKPHLSYSQTEEITASFYILGFEMLMLIKLSLSVWFIFKIHCQRS